MKKHKINSVIVTSIYLQRELLITKEEMESYCKGERRRKDSLNDDFESFFENIRLGKKPKKYPRLPDLFSSSRSGSC